MQKSKGIIIATAVATAFTVTACRQRNPSPGSATMTMPATHPAAQAKKTTHKRMRLAAKRKKGKASCKAHSCKANACKGKNGQTCNAKNGCNGKA